MADCFCLKLLTLERLALDKKTERLPLGDRTHAKALWENGHVRNKIIIHKSIKVLMESIQKECYRNQSPSKNPG